MIGRHAVLYTGSRLAEAVVRLCSTAAFTRLIDASEFGAYLLILSVALILYGLCGQWTATTFFAQYTEDDAAQHVTTLAFLALIGVSFSGLLLVLNSLLGLFRIPALPVFLFICSLAVLEVGLVVARTRLQVEVVTLSTFLGAVLCFVLGVAALRLFGTATALAVALALGNAVSALPALIKLRPLLTPLAGWTVPFRYVKYGWPLTVAFGLTALGQQIDRLLLASILGTAALGAYGAIANIVLQGFSVVGNAVSLSLVSIAKQATQRGQEVEARKILESAFKALTALTVFGFAFALEFRGLLPYAVGPGFRDTASALIPYIAFGGVFFVFRSFYFGQAIYFTSSSRPELLTSLAFLVCVAALTLVLTPRFGVYGAAVAVICGHVIACVLIVLVTRSQYAMPFPAASAAGILAWAGGFLIAAQIADRWGGLGGAAGTALGLILFLLVSLYVVWRFNIVEMREMLERRMRAATS